MQKSPVTRIFAAALAAMLILSLCAVALAKYATIPYGEKSDAVRKMQTALKEQGYYTGDVDGSFGPATKSAVRKFQAAMGIQADGRPGNKTLTALYEGGSTAVNEINNRRATSVNVTDPDSIHYGATGSRVRSLQKALKAAGYFNSSVDGKFGDLTELAVRKFQTAQGLRADGIAGKKTLAALNKAQNTEAVSSSFLLDIGSKGETVATVQRTLRGLGYNPDPSIPGDPLGTYGASTADRVMRWKAATGNGSGGTLSESEYNALVLSK